MTITKVRKILDESGYGARKLSNLPGCYNVTWNGRAWFTINIAQLSEQQLRARIAQEKPNITLENCL